MGDLIVAISPHADDAEWGAGGFLAKHAGGGYTVNVVLAGMNAERQGEAETAAGLLGCEVKFLTLSSDGHLESSPFRVDTLAQYLHDAELILVPPATDTHQDHRAARDLALSAVRRGSGSVWEYRTPSAYNWAPNVFCALSKPEVERKEAALAAHESQADRTYMLRGLARARAAADGVAISERWAEGFRVVRHVV